MHDFIQSLSFRAQSSPTLTRTATDALRGIMRSFEDEVPAYRPSAQLPKAPRRPVRRNPKS